MYKRMSKMYVWCINVRFKCTSGIKTYVMYEGTFGIKTYVSNVCSG